MTTYRLEIEREDGTVEEELHSATAVARRLMELSAEQGMRFAYVWTGSTLVASIEPRRPPRHTVLTWAQMHARKLDEDAKLGFTRD